VIVICIISLFADNIPLNTEAIEKGACSNPDGHGWVVASAEFGLVMGKSMHKDESIQAFVKERERQGASSIAMFHSRIGTHGTKDVNNVHPFYVPDATNEGHDFKTVMAHNGIMPSLWFPRQEDPRSDTRVFADRTATWYLTERGVPSRRGGAALGEMIGRGNKLVFISTRLPGRPHIRIVNAQSGVWDDGVWYSNESYKRARYSRSANAGKMCREAKCTTWVYNGNTLCYKHKPEEEKKTTPVTTSSVPVAPAADRKEGWVSPYANSDTPVSGTTTPQQWTNYGIFPPPPEDEEIDSEAQSLLDDIERSLGVTVTLSDIDRDRHCEVCRLVGHIHTPTNVCTSCYWCLDCFVHIGSGECHCFDYAKWIKRRDEETVALATALAAEAEEERVAEEEREAAEAAEERWLAMTETEQVQAIKDFYGISLADAKKVLHGDKEARKKAEVKETEPKALPAPTKPTVKSAR
jgi:glutamine amidotransferase